MLHFGRGRQDVVGVACRIGQELFVDHGEEILPAQSRQDQLLVRRHGREIAVIDDQRANRWGECHVGQGPTELDHIDRADRLILQFRHPERSGVECLEVEPRGHVHQPASTFAPRTDQCRETGDGAEDHGSMAVVLHPYQETDHGRTAGRVSPRQPHDLLGLKAR